MPQRNSHDRVVRKAIQDGKIRIDSRNGIVYSNRTDIGGTRHRIGFKDKNGDHLFTFKDGNKCFTYYVCRAIWLEVHSDIAHENIVVHVDGNKDNNAIENLILNAYEGKNFSPKTWTQREMQWLEQNCVKKSLAELSELCGRSIKSVRHKIKGIDISPKRVKTRPWTELENKQLSKMYEEKMSVKEISREIKRSEPSVRLQANRKLGLFRSDRHLQRRFRGKSFYHSLKGTIARGTSGSQCCLCDYRKHIELHHRDGNHANNAIYNIASLCPNHHTEVEHGEHLDGNLFCIWWRIYSDGFCTERYTNEDEIKQGVTNE